MQFIYVLPGWEGSASDARVLRDAINRRNGLKVPTGIKYENCIQIQDFINIKLNI